MECTYKRSSIFFLFFSRLCPTRAQTWEDSRKKSLTPEELLRLGRTKRAAPKPMRFLPLHLLGVEKFKVEGNPFLSTKEENLRFLEEQDGDNFML